MRKFICGISLLLIATLISSCSLATRTPPQAVNARNQTTKTEIVAHRGGVGNWSDNSLEAFSNAASDCSTAVETDVHTTKDGIHVLSHENFILVDDIAYKLKDYDYARLKALKPDLCTLDEALAFIADTDLKLLLEIKVGSDIAYCVDAVRKYGLQDRTAYISFSKKRLKRIRKYDPAAKLGLIIGELPEGLDETISELDLSMICQRFDQVTQSNLSKWHDMGIHVNAWGIDEESEATKYLEWGVDSITSDYPENIAAAINAQ